MHVTQLLTDVIVIANYRAILAHNEYVKLPDHHANQDGYLVFPWLPHIIHGPDLVAIKLIALLHFVSVCE